MDLTAEQSKQITALVQEWFGHSKFELETTFGHKGVVDSNVFLQIAQRLRSKGFEAMPQEDYLNIIVPNDLRFTIQGTGILQSYCRDDTLEDKPYTVIRKDKIAGNSTLDIPEYDIRFKIRREEEISTDDPRAIEMIKQWKTIRKAFRLIRRWSFKGKGVRIDLSMIRQSPTVAGKQGLQWSTTFLEKNVLAELPRYEVEVELLHDIEGLTDRVDNSLRMLIGAVGEVQRAIQKNTLLIRKSVAQAVRAEYLALTGGIKFRGVSPITLEIKNMVADPIDGVINVRSGFNVTDKADGLRAMGFVDSTGHLYLVDQSLNIYRTGLRNEACASSIVDGEWITTTVDGKPANDYLVFDIYTFIDGKPASIYPFATFKDDILDKEITESRYNLMHLWHKTWSENEQTVAKGITPASKLMILVKHFEFGRAGDDSIFRSGCSKILNMPRKYYTDGLILTSNARPIPSGSGVRFDYQFKWKPAKDNTVDFLVTFEKDPSFPQQDKVSLMVHPDTNENVRYKTMRLYVGGQTSMLRDNPRLAVLSNEPIGTYSNDKAPYRPILFHPSEFYDTMSNTCYSRVETHLDTLEDYVLTEDSQEPITQRCIVEMRYDPAREPGWRWIPARIRHDKTERLLRAVATAKNGVIVYSGMMNDIKVANSVWNSIHEPITESMIRSGNETPQSEELIVKEAEAGKKYYERKASKEDIQMVRGLQIFHNTYIKNDLLLRNALRYSVGGGSGKRKLILDLACGKGGDLMKWVRNRARAVVGIDISSDNITNPSDGAYKRYVDAIEDADEKDRTSLPKMAFTIGSSARSIVDGSAGATPEERDILRSLFGRIAPEGAVPPYISQTMGNLFREGTDVAACMFALHYFFENSASLDGFLKNLAETVKLGGYFIGCCFDGDKVFDLLRDLPKGRSQVGQDGDSILWSIKKQYEQPELTTDDTSLGLAIDVEFITIGSTHREYLVPFNLLKEKMAEIGFRLLNPMEQREMGLQTSSSTFDKVYDQLIRSGKKLEMPNTVKDFSFLNRWFIFKRQGVDASVALPEEEEEEKEETGPERGFAEDITRMNATYKLYNTVESSQYSVLKPWHKPQVSSAFKAWFPTPSAVKRIVDATAHIGMDSIHMSTLFPQARIDAYELVPEIYQKLLYNIKVAQKNNVIYPHNEDISTWSPPDDAVIDLLYVDPPWGGAEFAKKEKVDLYLQKEHNNPQPEKNLNRLVDKWIQSHKIHHIIIKTPPNFDKSYLESTYPFEQKTIFGRPIKKEGRIEKNVAFLLIHIRSPYAPAAIELESDMKDKGDEKEPSLVAAASAASAASSSTAVIRQTNIFRFGIGAKIARDILGVKIKLPDGKEVSDTFISQWMAPYALFAIPDPDLKTKKGESVMYPSVEHYVAAMKLRHASNKHAEDADYLAVNTFSTQSDLHTKYTEKRMALTKGAPFVESDKYYELCIEEAMTVRQLVNKKDAMKAARIVFDEVKWNSMKDKVWMDALRYRWENDARFHNAVEAARRLDDGRGRYLLYTMGTSSNAVSSELGGKLSTVTHKIEGENKVGVFIMKLAGFSHWV